MSRDGDGGSAAEAKRRVKDEIKASTRRVTDELKDQAVELHAEAHGAKGKGRRRRGGGGRKPRSVDEIVHTALRLADDEGFAAVTMRRVAAELGYGTMSLYWYVDSRDELVDLMFDAIIDEQILPEPVPEHWREGLEAIARAARDLHLRHPWLAADRGLRPSAGPNLLRHVEQSLAVTAELADHPVLRANAVRTVDEYVLGFVANEAFASPDGGSAMAWFEDLLPTLRASSTSGAFPHLLAALEDEATLARMLDEHFEGGLALVLDGVQAALDRTQAAAVTRPAKAKRSTRPKATRPRSTKRS